MYTRRAMLEFSSEVVPCSFSPLKNNYPPQPLYAFPNKQIIIFHSGMIGYERSKPEISQKYLFVSIRISKCYFYFYLTQILISIALLICLILHYSTPAIVLEILACLLLGVDLQLRCAAEGINAFLKSKMNLIDVSVFVIIVCMIAIDFLHPALIHHPEEDVSFIVLTLRYSIQFWRVFELSKESKKQFEINTLDQIDLSAHIEDHDNSIQN